MRPLTLQGSLVTADDVALILLAAVGVLLLLSGRVGLELVDDLTRVLLRLLRVTRVTEVSLSES